MFNVFAYSMVDSIQESKIKFVNQFVTNPEINKIMTNFVTSQSKYTKQAIDAGADATTKLGQLSVDKSFYTEAFEPVKAAFEQFKNPSSLFPTASVAKAAKKAK